jgi:signal transduction histidine kinase
MRDIPGENTPENIQVIIDEATRLTTLVNDLLDLSKLQSGVSEIRKEEFDITGNIKEILKRFSKLTEQDGYSILFEYRGNATVYADEYKIYQVIYNLIINAINYSGEDKTVIVRQIVHGNIVRIEIEDHGNGIAKDELDNIWDRYYKVDKNHKRAIQGTGLGLSIVQNILKLHEAKYGVHSTLGKGSIFWFELKSYEE